MRVRTDDIERFGGLAALQARVKAFQDAIEAHKLTTGQPAPVEASLVELLARTKQKIEAWEPAPVRGSGADTIAITNQMNEILLALTQRIQQLEFNMDKLLQVAQAQLQKDAGQAQVQAARVPAPPVNPPVMAPSETPKPQ